MDVWSHMQSLLSEMERRHLRRRGLVVDSAMDATVTLAGTRMTCLASNNYLGLANDPAVVAATKEGLDRWGVGAGSSRLVCGTSTPHIELQQALADFKQTEAALVTTTGWQANHCAVAALAGEGDLVVMDKLNHASIIDAVRYSGATFRTYRHDDLTRLRAVLNRNRPEHRRCLIVTDGLFSMDGDVAPLQELAELKQRYDCILAVDEAHATGVLGEHGRGAAEAAEVEEHVDVTIGTLSKALGCVGGFIAGRRVLIDLIYNIARPFVYTTALPPALCCAASEALRIVREEPTRREILLRNAEQLRSALKRAGLDTGASTTQIIPIIVGEPQAALELARKCFAAGFLCPAIRPPTVPAETSRLRVSVMAGHDWRDLQRFVEVVSG